MKIREHSKGSYYTTLTVNSKKHFIYGSTPEEVEAKYTEMKYKAGLGYNINDNPRMDEYMTQWYNTYKKGKGAIETQRMYQNCINTHIDPALRHLRVKEVSGTQVQKLLNGVTSSKSLAHKVKITLNQIFKQAMADHLIVFNPVLACTVEAPNNPKREYLNKEQRAELLEVLQGDKFYPVVFIILYTGMRMGEILALMWVDVDLENRIIHVHRAVEFDHADPLLKDPKTENGFRDIPIPEPLHNFLKDLPQLSEYVYPGPDGKLCGRTTIMNRWKRAKKKLSFNLTFRALRHTYCTGLYDADIDEMTAAAIMGHDPAIMREVYTHISEERKTANIIKLDNIYSTTSPQL